MDGGYSTWSTFGNCSRCCGGGVRQRVRHCDQPTPLYGGHDCSDIGPDTEVEECNVHVCPGELIIH